MTSEAAPESIVAAARARGKVSPGGYRVVVWEPNGRLNVWDYGDLESAQAYANDATSESDDPPALAYVFDDKLEFVARGRHYAAS